MFKRKSMLKRLITLCTIAICTFMFTACNNSNQSQNSNEKSNEKDEVVIAVGGETSAGWDVTLDSAKYYRPLLFSKLTTIGEDGKIENDLATEYSVSNDGLKWTFKIRDDVKFTDGQKLKAEDVAFTYNQCKENAAKIDMTMLEKAEAVDDETVEFTLKKPMSTFLYQTASLGIVPKHAYSKDFGENPIGSGPFKFVQWDKGQQLIAERNDDYYGEKPKFKKVVMLFMDDDAAFAAAQAGTVDVIMTNSSLALQNVEGYHLVKCSSIDTYGITFPMNKSGQVDADGNKIGNDVTSDIAIRKAFCYGIDRDKLCEDVLNGFGRPAYSVCDGMPWFNEKAVPDKSKLNLDTAKKILDENGWKDSDGDGIREKDGVKAEFNLIYPSNDGNRQAVAFASAEQAKEMGIKVNTQGYSWDEIYSLWYENPIVVGGGNYTPKEVYDYYYGGVAGVETCNMEYYKNSTVDEYMDKALSTTDENESNEYWKKAQLDGNIGASMEGDAPICWFTNTDHLYFVRDGLNIESNRIHTHRQGIQIIDNITKWSFE